MLTSAPSAYFDRPDPDSTTATTIADTDDRALPTLPLMYSRLDVGVARAAVRLLAVRLPI
jgi:hypothetical protein